MYLIPTAGSSGKSILSIFMRYVRSSMGPFSGASPGPGKGNRFKATSSTVTAIDHTSELILFFAPGVQFQDRRSAVKERLHLRILAPAYSLGREVVRRADKGAGEAVDEFARDAEIAELDQTVARDQHIRRFDVCQAASISVPSHAEDADEAGDSPRWMIFWLCR